MDQNLMKALTTSTKNRYPTIHVKQKTKHWHPEHELFYLSEKILEWFYNDELGVIIIHGQQGYGKSSYACISGAEVYGHELENSRFYYNWNAVKKNIVFTPRQFIELSRKTPPKNSSNYKVLPTTVKKEPVVIWDDAGYWLNAMDYRDKLCVYISKFLEVARTRWGAIIFTVSDQRQLLNKVRGIPHAWTIPIRKSGTPKRGTVDFKYKHDRRIAKLHKSWCSEDLKKYGKKGKECDIFYSRMPTNFYNWYKPFRDSFCDQSVNDMDKAAKELGL